MSATAYCRGHKVHYDELKRTWVINKTNTRYYDDIPCKHCGETPTGLGHDSCIGLLDGVSNACCGHGVIKDAYIQFSDGFVIRGICAIQAQAILKNK
jgi:hypothetical protein